LLTRNSGPVATGQQLEAVVETIGDDLQWHRTSASRCELQCEWDAVQASADTTDGLCIRFGQCEMWKCGLHTSDEKFDRRVAS
jgi:hypothetical protein